MPTQSRYTPTESALGPSWVQTTQMSLANVHFQPVVYRRQGGVLARGANTHLPHTPPENSPLPCVQSTPHPPPGGLAFLKGRPGCCCKTRAAAGAGAGPTRRGRRAAWRPPSPSWGRPGGVACRASSGAAAMRAVTRQNAVKLGYCPNKTGAREWNTAEKQGLSVGENGLKCSAGRWVQ